MVTGLLAERQHMATGHLGASGVPLLGQMALLWTASPHLFLGTAAGLAVWVLVRRPTSCWPALALVVCTLAMTAVARVQFLRYLYPLYPAAALFIARGIQGLSQLRRPWLTALLVGAMLGPAVRNQWKSGLSYLRPRSTEQALMWMEQHLPPGSLIAKDWAYVPQLYSHDEYRNLREEVLQGQLPAHVRARFAAENYRFHVSPIDYSVQWLRSRPRGSYLVTSDWCFGRFFPKGRLTGSMPRLGSPPYEEFQKRREFYTALFTSRDWLVLETFSTGNGPMIYLFLRQ